MKITVSLFLTLALVVVPACKKDSDVASDEATPAPSESAADDTKASPAPDEAKAAPSLDGLLADYEKIRAQLAADNVDGLAANAEAVKVAAKAAVEGADDSSKELLAAAAAAAETLGGTDNADVAAVRLAFGELSKAMVALVEGGAANGHVFECPMAKGYKRWVQPTDKLENPYMGAKMLHCGGEVELAEK